ncbi:GNAT family N-acetyltransferase [Microbacterium bovistercoris]|uniref:GNAT family N-acetyltransferase n=1 Tax=Microbacterium bovistercoris TaxID=2293570 RepID=A0A371NPD0_9MICO|nr:GNAT family N-acetyltransferase [Microbacterium bovistercoris]REJ04046.1 GNAT family N-acetyltransferase [Microbacterium bovistercoris]
MNLTFRQDARDDAVHSAASIWARATAMRDGLQRPAPAEDKIPGIRSALAVAGASLHVAERWPDDVGFAVLVPNGRALELRYLGADPEAWGTGVGGGILEYVEGRARSAGFDELTLWVLEDNERAIGVYERSGWRRTPDMKSQLESRRTECRLHKALN